MQQEHDFLAGGGEMGVLMRAKDWSRTPLGPIESWPQSLRSAVSILLPSKAQIALFWGPDLITLYNDAYRPVFGGKHPQALGQPIREAWSELWGAGLKELFENVLSTGEAFWARDRPFYMERHGYPEETFFDVSYDPVRDESGGVGGVFCIVSETTARVVGERRLKVLRDLAAAPSQAHGVDEAWALSASVLSAAQADVPFFDLDLADAAGWPVGLHEVETLRGRMKAAPGPWPEPARRVMVLPLDERAGNGGGKLALGVSSRLDWDDEYAGFFRLVAGQVASSIAGARAAEEERRRAQALAELDRAKTAFFSNVSHEFRTPLTLMLGPLQDLLERRGEVMPPEARALVEMAQRNGERLHKLVNTLLDFARIEAGRTQASYEPTDLCALTADLASNFRSACERAGLALEVNCPPLGEQAFVDREMWEKIVLNLLSNAFKFTLQGGIHVSLKEEDGHFVLRVRDTGIGIAAEHLPRMFERFHRVEGARGRSYEGSGIGLALVNELVKLHGGKAAVESEAGKGTTFTISIPRGSAHLPAERVRAAKEAASTAIRAGAFVSEALSWLPGEGAAAAAAAPGARSAQRILLADDNADLRDYARRLLDPHYEVEAVADGETALAAVRRRRPDLILSDVMMPRLDGFGLVAALRADPALRTIPVILLSARAGEESRAEGLARGADDYLAKPFTARELLVRVGALLQSAAIRREAEDTLRESEHRFRDFANAAPAMLWVTDAGGQCTFLSAAWYEFTGQTQKKGLGLGWTNAVHPDDRAASGSAFMEATRERVDYRMEYRLRSRDGVYRWMLDSGRPRFGPGGEFLGFTGAVIDVHERKLAEDALRQSEERYSRVLGLMPAAVYTCDAPSGVITYYNEHAVALWGRAPRLGDTDERFCGSFRLWRPDGAPLAHGDTPMAVAVRQGRAFRNEEVVIERPDGSRITALVNIDPVRDAAGRVTGAINVFHDISDRKRAAEALRASEEHLRSIIEATPECVKVVAPDGTLLEMNASGLGMVGARSADDVVGKCVYDVIAPEYRNAFRVLNERVCAGEKGTLEFAIAALDGQLRHAETHAVPLRRPDGSVVQLAITRDVTERKRAEEALRESERRLRLALEAGRMGTWEWDMPANRVTWSTDLEVLHGIEPGTFPGTFEAYQRDIHPEDREYVQRTIGETLQKGQHHLQYRIVLPDGTQRWVEGRGKLFRGPDGAPQRLVGVCVDVTERKRAEEALRDSEARYRAIVESQTEMVCRFRAEGEILFVNGAYARSLGTTPEALAGRSFWEFIPEGDQPGVRAMLAGLSADAPEVRIENRFDTADGPRWTLWTNRALAFDAQGRVAEVQSTGIDITARKQAEEALRDADRRKDEFIATLSHELRNPLAPLRNALHLLRIRGRGADAPIHDMMERQVGHLVRLVDDLLEIARVSRGSFELRRERVEVAAIVRNAVETSDPLVKAAGHALSVSVPPEPMWVEGDAVRLAQILANLLNNAAKYTDPGGRIELRAEARGGEAAISVRDNGAGISAEALPRLFEMFSRGGGADRRGQEGLGIGLALSRRLAEMHGGTVEGASAGPGRGSEFTLRLPLSSAPPRDAGAVQPAIDARLAPRRVLIVDDNRDAADSLGMLLKVLGADVRVAHDGPSALDEFEAYRPSVVLLDIGMPGMDGYEVAQRIRSRENGTRTPLVALTGWGQPDDRRQARDAGFDHHLVKPADLPVLQALLGSLEGHAPS